MLQKLKWPFVFQRIPFVLQVLYVHYLINGINVFHRGPLIVRILIQQPLGYLNLELFFSGICKTSITTLVKFWNTLKLFYTLRYINMICKNLVELYIFQISLTTDFLASWTIWKLTHIYTNIISLKLSMCDVLHRQCPIPEDVFILLSMHILINSISIQIFLDIKVEVKSRKIIYY